MRNISSSVNKLTECKTSHIKSDSLSDYSIPSCLWLPHGPVLNKGSVVKCPSEQVNNETPNKKQTSLLHHGEMSDKSNTEDLISKCNTTDMSVFSEFVTNGEAMERERFVNDKFSGILYHVFPTFNQISILFSSKTLYSQFIGALEKEMHSRSSNKDNPIYQTHLQGKKGVITYRKEQNSVLLTGQGMCVWRETRFL